MGGKTGGALLSLAIRPKTEADRERLARGVTTLMAEDPTMSVETDPATGEVVIAGMGELHLEIIVDRLKREFHVEASVGRLQVAYKETLTRPADGEGRYVRQGGGRGQCAHAKVHLYPGERGSGYVFDNEIIGSAIPREFIKPRTTYLSDRKARYMKRAQRSRSADHLFGLTLQDPRRSKRLSELQT